MVNEKKVLKLKKLNPNALKDAVGAASPSPTPTQAPKPYYSSY